jgi:heavy metal sensor kinase
VAAALAGRTASAEIWLPEGPMRVATFPISHDDQLTGVLQVGVSLEDIEDTLSTLLRVLLLMVPTTVLLASGGGWFLANSILTPIDRITRMAQRISTEHLSGRINLQGPDDEVRRLAQTFDAMLARLEAGFAQQRAFAANASHELRTPLTAIIGQIDVTLERRRSAESYQTTLGAVREQAQRLARLASDLLFLTRADTQHDVITMELLELEILLTAVVAQVATLAAERDQTIALAPLPALPIQGSEDHLIRMLLNLLDNAIRYTPVGGRISVAGAREGANIVIRVRDSGPGIAPEHLPRLFDRFSRVDRWRNRAQGGSGLGLALAQGIAQQHGGQITVESVVGQGSTFTVILPAAAGDAGPQAQRVPLIARAG